MTQGDAVGIIQSMAFRPMRPRTLRPAPNKALLNPLVLSAYGVPELRFLVMRVSRARNPASRYILEVPEAALSHSPVTAAPRDIVYCIRAQRQALRISFTGV